ncbi:hypothetical protein NXW75_02075 [Bacteroides xylanisolvens]|nr:hypothetical protein [Bacteroides xylanisolvens]
MVGNLRSYSFFVCRKKERITYAYVFNYGDWKPAWWGKTNGDSVTFADMPVGAVFLPAYYRNGWMIPAGFPGD